MASVNQARMPLLDHLRELRKRVLRSAIAVLVAFTGGWYFYDVIYYHFIPFVYILNTYYTRFFIKVNTIFYV